MDHHFNHQQQQPRPQANVENVAIRKRPNTAMMMKQFYKPGDRPKSALSQHKLTEWKCECGQQLYVNKVMNLDMRSSFLTKGFHGRKIVQSNTNLVNRIKGNDIQSQMKFKELQKGSRISPYDILMEKYVSLKSQEEHEINLMNYTNHFDQLQQINTMNNSSFLQNSNNNIQQQANQPSEKTEKRQFHQLYNLQYQNNQYQNNQFQNSYLSQQQQLQPLYHIPTHKTHNQKNNYHNSLSVPLQNFNFPDYLSPQQSPFNQSVPQTPKRPLFIRCQSAKGFNVVKKIKFNEQLAQQY